MGDVALGVIARVSAALAVVAGVDILWTRYRFEERIKMSRQEIKDEMKETEGSPEVRARRKQAMRERLKGKSLESQVKDATVIAVNPTHYSVALRYWPGQDPAPVVLAKGVDHKAQKIREIARKHGIPIIENKPLTRLLYKVAKEGQVVPADLYQAVANLLAIVYRMRTNDGGRR
jgi:flagellar biosynthesis protein FlhB